MTFRLQLACAVIGVGLFAVWLHRACQPDVPSYSGPDWSQFNSGD
jgi:hypothetical protein